MHGQGDGHGGHQDDDDRPRLVTRADVDRAALQAGVPEAAALLWAALAPTAAPTALPTAAQHGRAGRRTTAAEVAVYTGGVIALLAMSVFAGSGWAQYGPRAGLGIVTGYLVVFVLLAELLRRRARSGPGPARMAAGVVAAVAVCTVPLVVYAAHAATGVLRLPSYADYDAFDDWGGSVWMAMEVGALVAAVAAWLRHRTSFLLAPLVAALASLVLDLGDAVSSSTGTDLGRQVAAWLLAVALAGGGVALDRRGHRREAFWPHLGSLLAVGLAVLLLEADATPTALAFLALGVAAIAAGVVLDRRVHLALGGLYLVGALSYFAFDVFGDTVLFAPALAVIGLLVLLGGVLLARRRPRAGAR
ncbi:hypothetical protein FHN55_05625 [Streptomyces sp. NP160]|uniref:hypothetical protein n=1 Tax=Streptomyces sp. NP160 TaxID=2586637 RepID=UPI00111B8D09|nr:hypothetical protein [Streptomyces sp. NP160]TNM68918.1 hypothetical protein FHN55_05625 [Streptomyces sp. NP160]